MEVKTWLSICVGLVVVLQTTQRSPDIPGLIEAQVWSSNNVTRRRSLPQFPGLRDTQDWSTQGSTVDEPESAEESDDKFRKSKAVSISTLAPISNLNHRRRLRTTPTTERMNIYPRKRKTRKTTPGTTTKRTKNGRRKKRKLRKQTTELTTIKIHTNPIARDHNRKRSQPTTEKPRKRRRNPKKSRKIKCDGNCCKKI